MKKLGLIFILISTFMFAKDAAVINAEADIALKAFKTNHASGYSLITENAKAYLIFPKVIKAGIGIGGEYGEGVLRTNNGVNMAYYSTAAASIGFQLGAQTKSVIVAFLTEDALKNFMNADGWKVGVDGSVTLIKIGATGAIDTSTLNKPIVGFIFGEKGLMYNLTLEGSKFSKINR